MFYMIDLKLFSTNEEKLVGKLTVVKEFGNDIRIDLGLDKWANTSIELDIDITIKWFDLQGSYKSLGINEGDGVK